METIRESMFKHGLQHNRQVLSDYILESCTFDGWAGLRPSWEEYDPNLRPTIRNVILRNTNAYSAYLDGAIVEDVTVDTTKAGKNPLFLRGNVYRHVVLKGRIGPIQIRGKIFPPTDWPEHFRKQSEVAWDNANSAYYKTVDWALDITEATYGSLHIDGVPAGLIRRNPENTAIVTRARALPGKWRELEYKHGAFETTLSWFLDDGYDDVLLIACPRS
jgi:hypothetical protein